MVELHAVNGAEFSDDRQNICLLLGREFVFAMMESVVGPVATTEITPYTMAPIGERSLLAAMEILIDELLDLLGVVLDILAERLVIEGLQLGDDAIDHGR